MKVLTLELATEIIVFASPEVPISRIGADFIYTNKKNNVTKTIGQDLLEKNKKRFPTFNTCRFDKYVFNKI